MVRFVSSIDWFCNTDWNIVKFTHCMQAYKMASLAKLSWSLAVCLKKKIKVLKTNRPEPRSGPTYVGPDLGSGLLVVLQKFTFHQYPEWNKLKSCCTLPRVFGTQASVWLQYLETWFSFQNHCMEIRKLKEMEHEIITSSVKGWEGDVSALFSYISPVKHLQILTIKIILIFVFLDNSIKFSKNHKVRFIWFFSGCPPGCGTEDEAGCHFICTGLHRRVSPLWPGIAQSRETGLDRVKAG